MARGIPQISRRTVEHDPALVDYHDVPAEVFDKVELMAGEHHTGGLGSALREDVSHGRHPDWVKTAERFIEHEKHRVVHDRRGQLDPLLVAMQELFKPVVGAVAETERFRHIAAASFALLVAMPWSRPRNTNCWVTFIFG